MFNSLVGTQTPNVQYWDFSKARAGTSNAFISLEDDCAPLQYFSTGGTTTAIKLYLPINPANGKQITIVNNQIGTSTQQVTIYDSTNNNSQIIFNIGSPQTVTLIYIAQNVGINSGTTTTFPTGWVSLNNSTLTGGPSAGSIMQGSSNTMAGSQSSVIGGGYSNTMAASISSSVIGGGNRNTMNSNSAVIGGGVLNSIGGSSGVIGGGTSNVTTGNFCTVGGGQANSSGTQYSVIAGGFSNGTQGQYGTVGGGNSNYTGSGFFSTIAGGSDNGTANYGTFIGGGRYNSCTGNFASILGGINATTRVIDGMSSINASNITLASVGGMQSSLLNLYCQTTTATAATLSSNNGVISTANQIILPNNAVYYYKGSVVANGQFNATTPINTTAASGTGSVATIVFAAQTAAPFTVGQTITVAGITPAGYNNAAAIVTASTATTVSYANATTGVQTVAGTIIGQGSTSAWTIEGQVKRVVGVSQTFLVGTPTVTLISRDANAATWAIAVTADTVNGGLTLTATGVAGQTISWVARINTTESTY